MDTGTTSIWCRGPPSAGRWHRQKERQSVAVDPSHARGGGVAGKNLPAGYFLRLAVGMRHATPSQIRPLCPGV